MDAKMTPPNPYFNNRCANVPGCSSHSNIVSWGGVDMVLPVARSPERQPDDRSSVGRQYESTCFVRWLLPGKVGSRAGNVDLVPVETIPAPRQHQLKQPMP